MVQPLNHQPLPGHTPIHRILVILQLLDMNSSGDDNKLTDNKGCLSGTEVLSITFKFRKQHIYTHTTTVP